MSRIRECNDLFSSMEYQEKSTENRMVVKWSATTCNVRAVL
jgi:hypothetical protein